MPTVAEFVRYLERFAPTHMAAEWDNVGLLLEPMTDPIERLTTCITLTPDIMEEAGREGAHLVISHHPVLFRGTKKLTSETSEGQLLLPLARAGIAVYSPH